MKRNRRFNCPLISSLFFIFIAFSCMALPVQAASDHGFTRVTLKNGLKVIYKVMKNQPRVSINAVMPIGMNGEKEKGIAHLLEHLVFRGGSGYNFDDIAGITVRGGGRFSGFTYITSTSFGFEIPKENLMAALKIFNGSVWDTDISEAAVALEKKIVLHELDMDYSERYQFYPVFRYLYPEFSYNAATIAAITPSDLEAFHRTYYQPQNVTYVVAGDFEPQPVLAELEKVSNSYGKGESVRPEPKTFDIPTQDVTESRNIYPYQYQVMLAYRFDGIPEKDRLVFKLLGLIYGTDLKINYEQNEFDIYQIIYRHIGDKDYFGIYYVERNHPFDEELFKQRKSYLRKYFREFKKVNLKRELENIAQLVELEETQSQESAAGAAQYEVNNLIDPDNVTRDTLSALEKITVKDLERVIDQYFKESAGIWILVKTTKPGGNE